ncbi:MAG: urate hydroxylase PuuD [Aureispira sp.]|nr:urate hydroxylase PuuD [Aureispira sp.]
MKKIYSLQGNNENSEWDKDHAISFGITSKWLLFIAITLLGGYIVYQKIAGTPLEGHTLEWMDLILRWLHIIFGISWIGASFYFVFLENSLDRNNPPRNELAGNLWAVHGGGFYYLEKYKVAPQKIPAHLHWFKYEAYFTWVTGTCLLAVVYYFNAESFLLSSDTEISALAGIGIGVGAIFFSLMVYTALSKTALLEPKNRPYFFIIMFVYLVGVAYLLMQVFAPRAAYIHMGAIMGTMMAANVFFVIIPAQKAMVFAAKEGKTYDTEIGKRAGWRSYHNNYFTLPVLFIMISNHFPTTFGHEYNWVVLAIISLAGAGIKHFHNVWERGEINKWIVPISILMLLFAFWFTAPESNNDAGSGDAVPFAKVKAIMNQRCTPCHSEYNSDDVFITAQGGVKFDTPEEIVKFKDRILNRAVITKSMPQGNKTEMTDEERSLLEAWIAQGAQLK